MNSFITQSKQLPAIGLAVALLALGLLTACEPSIEKRAQWAEEKRVECLDKFCDGDIPPKPPIGSVFMKFNGQLYLAPKEYFSTGINGASFNWWNHKPVSSSAPIPDEMQALYAGGKAYEVLIEIFLRTHDGIMHGADRYEHLKRAQSQGRLVSKSNLRPGLELWRTTETDGLGPGVWYVATAYVDQDPNGAVLSCRDNDPKTDRCVTAFVWQSGIAADMRFRAAHAKDWPEIYQETKRILQLIKKA